MASILVIAERYWPDGGGGELATRLVVDLLKRRFDVTVVTGSKNIERLADVSYVYEPLLSRHEKPILWLNSLRLVETERFRKLLRKHDIIYVPRFAFPVIPAAKKFYKKVIVHLHGYIPISYTAVVLAPFEQHRHRITRDDIALECMKGVKHCAGALTLWWSPKLARRWISHADKIICVSKRHAEIISALAPELRDKIEVVYNPPPPELVNAEPRKELNDVPLFLYVGGDSYIKGFYMLLQAIRKLARQGVRARFILTNNYSEKSLKLIRHVRGFNNTISVEVLGRVRYSELYKLRRKTWALLFPSLWEEPLPYVLIESALSNTVAVASRIGVVSELFGDAAAAKLTFEPGDLSGFVASIRYIASLDKEYVTKLGAELRDKVIQKLSQADILCIFET